MESNTERKARLRQAAGEAIERAIETGGDPFELMMEATGEGDNICVPYIQQHPFFSEKRRLFKTCGGSPARPRRSRARGRTQPDRLGAPPVRRPSPRRVSAWRCERLALVQHQRRHSAPGQPLLSACLRHVRRHDRGRTGASLHPRPAAAPHQGLHHQEGQREILAPRSRRPDRRSLLRFTNAGDTQGGGRNKHAPRRRGRREAPYGYFTPNALAASEPLTILLSSLSWISDARLSVTQLLPVRVLPSAALCFASSNVFA